MKLTFNYWSLHGHWEEAGVHNNLVLDLTDVSNADTDSDCVTQMIMPGDTDHGPRVSHGCL